MEVAPFAGAWIEIARTARQRRISWTSLPSRERGLKSQHLSTPEDNAKSLPSRERGLKCHIGCRARPTRVSLPSRERGLKCITAGVSADRRMSLPSRERGLKYEVQTRCSRRLTSLPSRERGLKSCLLSYLHCTVLRVAPFAGAWIEMRRWPKRTVPT